MRFFAPRSWIAALALCASFGAHAAGSQGFAYVSNQDGGVLVVDLATLRPVATIDIEAKEPRGIGVTPDGKYLVTANRDGGDLSLIDTATRKVVKHIPVGKNPEFVRVRGDRAYVSFEPSAKGGPPGKGGKEDDDDDKGPKEPAKIAVVDLKQMKKVGEITGGPETEGIEFSHDGKLLLVTNEADNTVTAHDLATGKLVKTVDTHPYGDRPRGIKASPDGEHYAVTLEYGDKLMVLDKDLKVVKTVATGKKPYGAAFDREGKRFFVAAFGDRKLQVFDGKTFAHLKDIPVGQRCWHFSFTPDDSKILVACGRSHDVHLIDANTYALLGTIGDLSLPWGIVVYPKAMGSLDAP